MLGVMSKYDCEGALTQEDSFLHLSAACSS